MFNNQVWLRRFIEVWQSSSSRREVAKTLYMSAGAVRQREKRYRANGIPLKEMESVESWEQLAEYAKELGTKSAKSEDDQATLSRRRKSNAI
jgi:hypothetical protein